jgi:hypothetical protein
MQPRHGGAELHAQRAGQWRQGGLDHRDVQAQFRCRRSDFASDESRADHHKPCPRAQFVAQSDGVVDRAQHVHSGEAR